MAILRQGHFWFFFDRPDGHHRDVAREDVEGRERTRSADVGEREPERQAEQGKFRGECEKQKQTEDGDGGGEECVI
jgi:hypothetical protein